MNSPPDHVLQAPPHRKIALSRPALTFNPAVRCTGSYIRSSLKYGLSELSGQFRRTIDADCDTCYRPARGTAGFQSFSDGPSMA
jgi:hypothetical protein